MALQQEGASNQRAIGAVSTRSRARVAEKAQVDSLRYRDRFGTVYIFMVTSSPDESAELTR